MLTILLMLAFVYNWVGYKVLLSCMELYEISNSPEPSADQSGSITIQIPVNLPFSRSSSAYESSNDEMEINGIQYRNIKRRLHNDSMELICVPDYSAMKWNATGKTILQIAHELQLGVKGKKNNSNTAANLKPPTDDCTRHDVWSVLKPIIFSKEKISQGDIKIFDGLLSSPFKPPGHS